MTQHEITKAAPLLDASGNLTEPGWARSLLPVYCRSQIRAPKRASRNGTITASQTGTSGSRLRLRTTAIWG